MLQDSKEETTSALVENEVKLERLSKHVECERQLQAVKIEIKEEIGDDEKTCDVKDPFADEDTEDEVTKENNEGDVKEENKDKFKKEDNEGGVKEENKDKLRKENNEGDVKEENKDKLKKENNEGDVKEENKDKFKKGIKEEIKGGNMVNIKRETTRECKDEDVKREIKVDIKGEGVKFEDVKDEDVKFEDVKYEDVKDEDVKDEDVKSEDVKSEDVKDEIKSEDEDQWGCPTDPKRRRLSRLRKKTKVEPKDENVKSEGVKDEIKSEEEDGSGNPIDPKRRRHVRLRVKTKVEPKDEVKQERDPKRASRLKGVKREPGRRVKREVKSESGDDDLPISDLLTLIQKRKAIAKVREKKNIALVGMSFSLRVPYWMNQCIEFQKDKRTWHPSWPCCLPNFFLEEPREAPNRDELVPCLRRLTKQQRREFRDFVEFNRGEARFHKNSRRRLKDAWTRYLHPERKRHVLKGGVPGPRPKSPYAPPKFQQHTKYVGPKGIMVDALQGSQIFEGWGKQPVDDGSGAASSSQGAPAGVDHRWPFLEQDDAPAQRAAASLTSTVAKYASLIIPAPETSGGGSSVAIAPSGACKKQIYLAARQSHVRGVFYSKTHNAWRVTSGNTSRRGNLHNFSVSRYRTPDRSEEEACEAARQAAVAYRMELVASGKVKVNNRYGKAAERASGVKGVGWEKKQKRWQVSTSVAGKMRMTHFPARVASEEAIEEARLAAVAYRAEWERRHVEIRVSA